MTFPSLSLPDPLPELHNKLQRRRMERILLIIDSFYALVYTNFADSSRKLKNEHHHVEGRLTVTNWKMDLGLLGGGSFFTNTMSNNPKCIVLFYVLCVHFLALPYQEQKKTVLQRKFLLAFTYHFNNCRPPFEDVEDTLIAWYMPD